jgi:succinoglycan biosynthesis transport protein ExoP
MESFPEASAGVSPTELYATTLGFLRRQFPVIAITTALVLALACFYIVTTPAKYSGQAVLLIDTHKNQVFEPQQSPLGDLPIDSATVDTQIEVLKSENIALAVIKELHLDEDPEFIAPKQSLIDSVIGFVMGLLPSGGAQGGPQPSAEFRRTRSALGVLQSGLSVKRSGLTYAIEIYFQSLSPDRAAQVANSVANAYTTETLAAKYESTRRAAGWLQDRLTELREQSSSAERAAVDFRAKNNIVDTGTGGQLLNEQQITQLDNALVDSRSHTAEAKARLDRVQHILNDNGPDPVSAQAATVTDSLHDEVITKLRQQYLDYGTKAADWSARYGPEHQAVVNVRNQMQELRRAIHDELQRIAETYKSEYEIAKAREDSVQKSLDELVSNSHTMNEAQVTLHNLESSATTYRSLYDNFLQHYTESVQQQSFPVTDARLITQATRPLQKSAPKTSLVMALASLGGLIFGVAVGMLREISDRAFRTTAQVEGRLRTECIGVLPLTKGAIDHGSSAQYPDDRATGPRMILRDPSLWSAADSPLSRFTETIRGVKVAADLSNEGKSSKVIAVTSSLPNEGKSTVAMALAQTIALSGGRVVLVDCDLRNSSLSHMLAPTAACGVLDAAFGRVPLAEVLWTEPTSNLAFIPAAVPAHFPESSDLLGCEETRKFFDALREIYDYIVVDLSPLAPIVDVRVVTRLVDSFVLVIEWGRTDMEVVEHALGRAPGVQDNLLGVVLNKVDMQAFARYETYHESYYSNRTRAQYGYGN